MGRNHVYVVSAQASGAFPLYGLRISPGSCAVIHARLLEFFGRRILTRRNSEAVVHSS